MRIHNPNGVGLWWVAGPGGFEVAIADPNQPGSNKTIISGVSTTGRCRSRAGTPNVGIALAQPMLYFELRRPLTHTVGASHASVVFFEGEDCNYRPGGNVGTRADARATHFLDLRPPPHNAMVYCSRYNLRVDLSY